MIFIIRNKKTGKILQTKKALRSYFQAVKLIKSRLDEYEIAGINDERTNKRKHIK
ncbi:MAG: hypothetical protein QXD05_00310 [Candidatus Pacearchaeota archaeon]